jgi:hypothetical protein
MLVTECSVCRDILPCSPFKAKQHFRRKCYLNLMGLRVSQARNQHEAGSKQTEVTCSSETSVGFQQTIQPYVPEDRTPVNNIVVAVSFFICMFGILL